MKQSFKRMLVSLLKHNLTLMAVSRVKRQPEELQDVIYGLALLSGNIPSLFRDQQLKAWTNRSVDRSDLNCQNYYYHFQPGFMIRGSRPLRSSSNLAYEHVCERLCIRSRAFRISFTSRIIPDKVCKMLLQRNAVHLRKFVGYYLVSNGCYLTTHNTRAYHQSERGIRNLAWKPSNESLRFHWSTIGAWRGIMCWDGEILNWGILRWQSLLSGSKQF
jgi:hypothetical protein